MTGLGSEMISWYNEAICTYDMLYSSSQPNSKKSLCLQSKNVKIRISLTSDKNTNYNRKSINTGADIKHESFVELNEITTK